MQQITSEGPWRELAPGVYVATCQPAAVNVGLVVGEDHALLIDAGSTPEQGARLVASAAELTGRAIDRVVITHAHFDHFFGLAGVQRDDVPGIGHESLVLPAADDPDLLALGLSPEDLVTPSDPLSIVRAIDLGARRVEIVYLGPAHSPSDLVVLIPDADVIFCGDLLEVGSDPHFGSDSTPGRWPMALDTVIGSGSATTRYVPGHGEPCDRQTVVAQRTNLSMVFGQAEQLIRAGVPLSQAVAALSTPTLPDGTPHPGASEWPWPFEAATIAQALVPIYAELAAQGVEPRTRLPLLG